MPNSVKQVIDKRVEDNKQYRKDFDSSDDLIDDFKKNFG